MRPISSRASTSSRPRRDTSTMWGRPTGTRVPSARTAMATNWRSRSVWPMCREDPSLRRCGHDCTRSAPTMSSTSLRPVGTGHDGPGGAGSGRTSLVRERMALARSCMRPSDPMMAPAAPRRGTRRRGTSSRSRRGATTRALVPRTGTDRLRTVTPGPRARLTALVRARSGNMTARSTAQWQSGPTFPPHPFPVKGRIRARQAITAIVRS